MDRERLLKLLPWISTPVLLVLIIGGWKLGTMLSGVSRFVLPPPEEVAITLAALVRQPDVWLVHTRMTLTETVVGFVIALATGLFVGAVLGRVLWLERAVRPLVVALQVIPKVALIPLFVIWFGFGITSKIVIAAIQSSAARSALLASPARSGPRLTPTPPNWSSSGPPRWSSQSPSSRRRNRSPRPRPRRRRPARAPSICPSPGPSHGTPRPARPSPPA